ncbi:MAG: glycosyltransferase [Paracoccaceae bacterium]
MSDGKTLLIYAPVPLHRVGDDLFLEDQACNGLGLWAKNFDRVIAMLPVDPGPPPPAWVPISAVGPALEGIEIVPLPMAYRPDRFFHHLPAMRRKIRGLIERSDYLGFAIGGLFGDWGAVAAWEAHKMNRRFYIWTDRVESEVTRRGMHEGNWRHRLRSRLTYRPMAWQERFLIRRCDLGMFHGRETFDTYAPYCRNPQLVHDIAIKKVDHISNACLTAKIESVRDGPLKIVYAGRADAMKGPMDWVDVCIGLARRGIDFRATYLGEGSERDRMRARIEAAGLSDRIRVPGFTRDRTELLNALRDAHVFMFCHKTPESPRCLIEALLSAAPIVGYSGAFAKDLIAENGGGHLVPLDDKAALVDAMAALAGDRARLADLIRRAAADGAPFDDESVYAHRSELIRANL